MKHKYILAGLLALLSLSAFADTATVTWTAPTQRVDGTALAPGELGEFRIYWGLDTSFSNTTVVSDPTLTTYVISGLTPGFYSFRMTAVDTAGLESAPSMVASKTVISTSPPQPPVITVVN